MACSGRSARARAWPANRADCRPPALPDLDLEALLFDRARRLNDEWMRLPPQQSLTLEFERRDAVTPG